jgi:hypothetical protein
MTQTSAVNRRTLAGTLLGLALAGGAQAQVPVLQPLVGGGVTFGGDKLLSNVRYDDGYSEDIQAGQFVYLYGGLRYQAVPQFSVQATLGYHVDDTREARNGSARFVRYPVEVLGHFHLDDQVRLGGGVRFVNGARFDSDGSLSVGDRRFDNTIGVVLEGEYVLASEFGLKLRFVSETYRARPPFDDEVNGSHVGLLLNWYLPR